MIQTIPACSHRNLQALLLKSLELAASRVCKGRLLRLLAHRVTCCDTLACPEVGIDRK